MKQYAKRFELKDKAKNLLNGNYGTMILGTFIFLLMLMVLVVITSMIELLASDGGDTASFIARLFSNYILQLAISFMIFGVSYMCLKLASRHQIFYTDIFYGLHKQFVLPVIIITTCKQIINTLCFSAADYLSVDFNLPFQGELDLKALLFYLCALLAGYIIYIPIALAFDLAFFLYLDFPDKTAKEVIRDSFKIIRGHRKRFFCLQLSFIPLFLLGYLSLGIGLLWLFPYSRMTYALFYLDLMNPKAVDMQTSVPESSYQVPIY